MAVNSGSPFPRSKLLWGRGEGQAPGKCLELERSPEGTESTERSSRPLLPHAVARAVSECALLILREKTEYTLTALLYQLHSERTLVLSPTQCGRQVTLLLPASDSPLLRWAYCPGRVAQLVRALSRYTEVVV